MSHLPAIHFAHANGFPSPAYQYFFDQLNPYPVFYQDVLGEGSYKVCRSWNDAVPDLIKSIERQHTEPVIGLGHSFGAVLTFRAAQQRPDLFRQIIMMEPPFLSRGRRVGLGAIRLLGVSKYLHPLAKKTRKRRDYFTSREEAHSYWGRRRFFQELDPRCFEDYVQYGLIENDAGFRLRIPREDEVNIFVHAPVFLGNTRLLVPGHYVYARHGDTLLPKQLAYQKRLFSNMEFVAWEGGHMFPLEQPIEVGHFIKSLIQS